MEIDFEEILVDNLNNIDDCLDNVFSYAGRINADKIIEAKAFVTATLRLIRLKNSKIEKEGDNKPVNKSNKV